MTDNPPRTLRGKNLVLRPIEERDAHEMLLLFTNDSIKKTYMLPDFSCRGDAMRLFENCRRLSADRARFVYAITLGGRVIGMINKVSEDASGVELGYMIHPVYWNKGYATEALTLCMEELFACGAPAVRAGYFRENGASRRVMEKCGMTATGETEKISYRGRERLCVLMEKRR